MATRGTRAQTAADALKELEAGIGLFYKNKFDQARTKFEAVIEADDRFAVRARDFLAACATAEAEPEAAADAYLEALVAKNDGDLARALTVCDRGAHDEDERFVYLAACLRALEGDAEKALDLLASAAKLEPKNRVRAFHDSDFASLHEDERFLELVHGRHD